MIIRAFVFAQILNMSSMEYFSLLMMLFFFSLFLFCGLQELTVYPPHCASQRPILLCSLIITVFHFVWLSLLPSYTLTYDLNDVLLYCLQLVGPATKRGLVWLTTTLTSTTA